MAQDGSDPSDVVAFYGIDLLHKFGFSDGDLLFGVIEEHDLGVDHHDLLVAVVEQLVVPRLDQAVVTSTWPRPTLHNPIRAATVDGEEASIDSTITPDEVEVPVAEIIRIARSLPSTEGESDDTLSAPSDASAPMTLSFGAEQLIAATRHVRRTFGGAELHLHHWLAAVLQDERLAGRVLADIDRDTLATALDLRLDEGDLKFPLSEIEARDRASGRARRASHDVVTTDDLAEVVVAAAAALLRQLTTTSAKTTEADANSTRSSEPWTRSSASSGRWPLGRRSSRSGAGVTLIVGGLVALAIALPIGWLLSRQRGQDAEDALRERIRDFTEVLATGDGDSACQMLSDEAAEDLAARVSRDLDEAEGRPCQAAVQVAASERTPAEDDAFVEIETGAVDYDEEWTPGIRDQPGEFERATASVVVAGGEVALLSENVRTDRAGSWTIEDPGPILDLLVPG